MLSDQIAVAVGERSGRRLHPRRVLRNPAARPSARVTLQAGLGATFVLAGALKSILDLGLYAAFRNVEVAGERQHVPDAADREGDR